jgi:ubiquinone/menaquinone biosynthesis C-methylase UbiE
MTKTYYETGQQIIKLIKEQLTNKDRTYSFADFGSHQGELMKVVLDQLSDYHLNTIAIDTLGSLKSNQVADELVPADLTHIPLKDHSVDFGMTRYVLQWNTLTDQAKILSEVNRVVKDFAIIQHVGADQDCLQDWQHNLDQVLDGSLIPKLRRTNYYFSSPEQIEEIMAENGLNFQRLSYQKIDQMSEIYITRFALNPDESELIKKNTSR